MKIAYFVFGLIVVGAYGIVEANGWVLQAAPRQVLPADARQSPGGYRSFHFWHSGWRGGK